MKKFLIVTSVVVVLAAGWLIFNTDIRSGNAGQLEEYGEQRYDNIVARMCDKEDIPTKKEVSHEYTIINSKALFGIEYIRIAIFADNTGIAVYKFKDGGDWINEGEIIYNKQTELAENETNKIVEIIEKNDFWNIPSVHPDEEDGLDGNTIYIEGETGEKYNIISMWSPLKKYRIRKIYDSVIRCCNEWGMELSY